MKAMRRNCFNSYRGGRRQRRATPTGVALSFCLAMALRLVYAECMKETPEDAVTRTYRAYIKAVQYKLPADEVREKSAAYARATCALPAQKYTRSIPLPKRSTADPEPKPRRKRAHTVEPLGSGLIDLGI